MLDLIDRWQAIRKVSCARNMLEVRNALVTMPNPDYRDHGFWFLIKEIQGDYEEEKKMCSLCHAKLPVMEMDFCPCCGAQMDLAKTEEER